MVPMIPDQTHWITTGEAAALLGYNLDHFRRKFRGVIASRRIGTGDIKWDRDAVIRLLDDSTDRPAA